MSEDAPAALALVGAGLVGRRHAAAIGACAQARLDSVADPDSSARAAACAAANDAAQFEDLESLLAERRPDGVLLATPNAAHVAGARACVAAGIPALIEKPIADDAASAAELVAEAEAAGVPLLVGHHRRHNPINAAARGAIQSGAIGRVTAAQAMFWILKPKSYFDVPWRRAPGAGPVLVNMIHDVDLLRWFCGEVVEVQAFESRVGRGFAVEDGCAAALRFAGGALGAVNLSDATVAPWSWEATARENPAYHPTDETCMMIGGTHGSLAIPSLALWRHPKAQGWWEPIEAERLDRGPPIDPLAAQIEHFVDVVRGRAAPLVSGREGLRTLRVIEAIKRAAKRQTATVVEVDA